MSISRLSQSSSGLRPAIESGSSTFSSAVRTGIRLKNWKTKPSLSRRSRVSSASSRPVISSPSSVTVPEVGRSSPARMCISVDLPEPDGPMIALKRPRSNPTLTPGERVNRGVALSIAAVDVRRGDDRIHAPQGGSRAACAQYG